MAGPRNDQPGAGDVLRKIRAALRAASKPEKRAFFPKFFQAHPGGYGEGDRFHGVVVPDCRRIAKQYRAAADQELVRKLLESEFHEERFVGLVLLTHGFERAKDRAEQKAWFELYAQLVEAGRVNNWDLVDLSAPPIAGAWFFRQDRRRLGKWARSGELWQERVAILSTFFFIRQGEFEETLSLCRRFLDHPHDLIHKACGWMLREVGKRDESTLLQFLDDCAASMPRTMLRYAIEKLAPDLRARYMRAKAKN